MPAKSKHSFQNGPDPVAKCRLAIVVLAAGAGSRMGGRKQLVEIEGVPMLRRIIEQQLRLGEYPVWVVLGAYAQEIREIMDEPEIGVLLNEQWEQGLSTSIRLAVSELEMIEDLTHIMFVLGDQPFIPDTHFHTLIDLSCRQSHSTVVSAYNDIQGVPAVFPKQHWQALGSLTGDRGARAVFSRLDDIISTPLVDSPRDIDRPEDLS